MNNRFFRVSRHLVAFLVAVWFFSGATTIAFSQQEESSPAADAQIQTLIDAIGNDETRAKLLNALESIKAGQEQNGAAEDLSASTESPSVGARLAELTQGIAESAFNALTSVWTQIASAPALIASLNADQMAVLVDALGELALVIIASYAIFFLLRSLAKRVYVRLGEAAAESGNLRTLFLILVSVLIDVAVVVLAWSAGYLITLFAFGEFGQIAFRQTLYLNAFLIVEIAKVAIRLVLSPSAGELRLLPIGDHAARRLNRWFLFAISVLGYGQLLLVPILNRNLSFAAGRSLITILSIIVVVSAIYMILRNAKSVSDWLLATPEQAERGRYFSFFAKRWHWPMVAYLVFLLLLVIARPEGVLLPVLWTTVKIAIAIVAGFVAIDLMGKAISKGISLPDTINYRLPLLERRLNGLVPKILTALRLLVFASVILYSADTLGYMDFGVWMNSDSGGKIISTAGSIAFILLAASVIWLALASWVDYRLNPEVGHVASSREETLLALLRNAAITVIIVITSMFALSELGIDIAPLIASAGVLGLAIGFGAQKLVQDIITGVFIQLENAINVGDVITVGGTTGAVERLSIRSVGLRDANGVFHIIPFSTVDMVSNFTREFSYHVADMGVAYRESIDECRDAMFEAFDRLREDPDAGSQIMGELEWFGVQQLADSAVVLRARIKTVPGKQWAIGRKYNEYCKRVFDARGIEIPFPHQTIYFGEDRQGKAPPARVAIEKQPNRRRSTAKPAGDK